MYYIDQRIEVIANQLKLLRFKDRMPINNWEYKEGQFFRPNEADTSPAPWQEFDSEKMHWYAHYAGTDEFEGKFKGQNTDFHGIPGTHYWFRGKVTIPKSMEGKSVWFKIQTQIEEWDDGKNPQFLIFVNDEVVQGADMNHREVMLFDSAPSGKELSIDIQAYTGTLHREFSFITSLYTLDKEIDKLYYDIQVPVNGFSRMNKDDKKYLDVLTVLNNAINILDMRIPYSEDFYNSIREATDYLEKHLYGELCHKEEIIATCIGQTHIDVAWWWTVAQTKEKVARSFATVLKLMEEYPGYKFMCSQPVLYRFLKERYPEVFNKIKERVAEGRWEVEGGMYLEADCNLTSGESIVRQFIHGKKFFRDEFDYDCKILWLPDVFGYSGVLPQILKKSGVDYFMTTKLSWNQINKVPNDTFMWKGIDGTEVLTHLITTVGIGQDPKKSFFTTYNGYLHPDSIIGGWERYQNKEINNDILVCYGYGDGGGGPTRDMLENSIRMEKGLPGMPKVRQATARTYFDELYERVKDNKRLETWEGEFYFEYHRGTYTSMGRNKRGNRKSEFLLMDLELLDILSGNDNSSATKRLWEDTILLNQFHDILPGSSIAEVYEVTKKEYESLAEEAGRLINEDISAVVKEGNGITLFNTTGYVRDDVVYLKGINAAALKDESGEVFPVQSTSEGGVLYVKNLPPKGYKTFEAIDLVSDTDSLFKIEDDYSLETPYYRISFGKNGRIISLFDKDNDREVIKKGESVGFRLYEDKPINYDNWDIDMYYTEKSWPVENLTEMKWIEVGPVRCTLLLKYEISTNEIIQKIHFYVNNRRIDFDTVVDWKIHQHLLKAEFPVDIHSDEATFEIQFGNVKRKVHTNTSWDKARFESCAQKWMDFSEGNYGVSLLNDCKYGHSVLNGVMGLTLVKSGVEPNPNADVEIHQMLYSLYPHGGDWKKAGTVNEAYNINQPVYAVKGGIPGESTSFARVDCENVVIETVKRAESGDGTILRLYESENSRVKANIRVPDTVKTAYVTNLLEEIEEEVPVTEGVISLKIMPYEIKTILLKD